ncbi:MAG: outer membrane beta-barrel protein [Gammaproteobacteria bacterium]|nr:outer membrane beta-barrel protein [Gammaproteobacteria bacterium]MBU1776117.1 outer membrane beta-barrel protein [Gammaproteobacteria bacterium]MBU1970097.1 outer membrane beta-barrel protein [Gammaproteobacteria bacterium]
MKRILTVTLLSFSFAAPALAAPASTPNADATRLYVGAQLGDSIVGAMLGLQINRSYALEIRYDYIDTIYQPNTTIRASSAGIAGIGMYPVKFGDMDPFYIFAKAGYERSKTKSTTNDPGIPGLFPATTTVTTTFRKRVVVGAGVQYDFSADVSGRIGMNAVGTDHSVYLAAIYKF